MIQDAFVRQRARQLYWQGYPPAEISRLMGINPNTIYAWKNATSGMKRHPCSVSRSPSMRASSSLLKNRIKQVVTSRK
ncbi:ATPase subunit of terminase family protein [Escherichia coli DEC12A]|nr:ATPase subunit of terminase family protein [Escherichia coli DEC12A]